MPKNPSNLYHCNFLKMNNFYTYFWLAKSKKNKVGLCPIYCRVVIDGKRTELCTKIYISPCEWCNKTHRVLSKKNEYLNEKLHLFRIEVEKDLILMTKKFGKVSVQTFKIPKPSVPTLIQAYKQYLDDKLKESLTIETIKSLKNSYTVFEKFISKHHLKNILVTEVDIKVIESFHQYLKHQPINNPNAVNKIGYSPDVIRKVLRKLVVVMDYTHHRGFIETNPLAHYKPNIKSSKKAIVFLEQEELDRLRSHHFATERLQQVADLFVFQCYTGFAYNELMSFESCHDTKTWNGMVFIQKKRGKTGTECLLPFFDKARDIYEKYSQKLPLLTNQKYNAYLKEVADIIGIDKKLTTHVARKTAAMRFYEQGASEQMVAKMLGHSTAKTTFTFYATVREQTLSRVLV